MGTSPYPSGSRRLGADDWRDQVYRPDIIEKADTLYKKPGYTM
jgi:4-oxalocrotonate tautomerase